MQKTLIASGAALFALFAGPAAGQSRILIDWSTRTVIGAPPSLGASLTTMVVIRNVNDVLYDYEVDIVEVRRQIDDFANLVGGVVPRADPKAGLTASDPCPTGDARTELAASVAELQKSGELTPVANKDGKFPSVRLDATLGAWNTKVAPHVARVRALAAEIRTKLDQCTDQAAAREFLDKELVVFEDRVHAIERKLSSTHTIDVPITLHPDTDYTIVVTEKYRGATTVDGAKSFVVSPASTVLTLSSGFGATWLEGRAYVAATAPGANPGEANRTLLRVDGAGVRPVVPALLNYQLPIPTNGDWGFAISSGPVFAFNSGTSNSSSLGVFVGGSVHLLQRFYVTPGLHLGEFSDYPSGFDQAGQPVPANFGELVPTKRWKPKFAIMFTYRTLDLSKSFAKPKVAPAEPKPAPKEK